MVWMRKITFLSRLYFVVRLPSPKMAMTAPATMTGRLSISLRVVFSSLADRRSVWARSSRRGVLPTRAYWKGRQTCPRSPLSGPVCSLPLTKHLTNEAQLASRCGCRGTRRDRHLAAIVKYAFGVIDSGNLFVAFASARLRSPNIIERKILYKIKGEEREWIHQNLFITWRRSLCKSLGQETNLSGSTWGIREVPHASGKYVKEKLIYLLLGKQL